MEAFTGVSFSLSGVCVTVGRDRSRLEITALWSFDDKGVEESVCTYTHVLAYLHEDSVGQIAGLKRIVLAVLSLSINTIYVDIEFFITITIGNK